MILLRVLHQMRRVRTYLCPGHRLHPWSLSLNPPVHQPPSRLWLQLRPQTRPRPQPQVRHQLRPPPLHSLVHYPSATSPGPSKKSPPLPLKPSARSQIYVNGTQSLEAVSGKSRTRLGVGDLGLVGVERKTARRRGVGGLGVLFHEAVDRCGD